MVVCKYRRLSRLISTVEFLDHEAQLEADTGETLGGRLVSAREAAGLSTAQLARRIGVTTDSLRAWEGDRDEPRANKLVTIAGVLNVSAGWLLSGGGDGPPDPLVTTELLAIRSAIERLRKKMIGVTEELEKIEEKLECFNSHQD